MKKLLTILFLLSCLVSFGQVEIGPTGGIRSKGSFAPINDPNNKIYTGGYNVSIPKFIYGYTSPAVGLDQGYAFDGTYNYVNGASTLQQRAGDWSSTLQSVSPFVNVSGTPTHCGDIAVDGSYVYTVTENFVACGSVTQQKIVIRDKSALATVVHEFDISAYVDEASYIEVTHDTLIVGSFCTGTTFWLFNANTGALLNTVALENTIQGMQGLGINQNDRRLYIGTETQIYRGDFTGASLINIVPIASYPGTSTHAGEGLAVYNDTVRALLVDPTNQVYSYYDNGTKNNIISALASGYLNAGKLNIGSSAGDAPITQLGTSVERMSFYTQGSLWGAHIGLDGTAFSLMANASYHNGWYKDDTTRGAFGFLYHYGNKDWEFRTARKTTSYNFSNWQIPFAIGSENDQITMAGSLVADSNNQRLSALYIHPSVPATTFTGVENQILFIESSQGNAFERFKNSATGGADWWHFFTNTGNGSGGALNIWSHSNSTTAFDSKLDTFGNLTVKGNLVAGDSVNVKRSINMNGNQLNLGFWTINHNTSNPTIVNNNTGTGGGVFQMWLGTNSSNGIGAGYFVINNANTTNTPLLSVSSTGALAAKAGITGTTLNGTTATFTGDLISGTSTQSNSARFTLGQTTSNPTIAFENTGSGGGSWYIINTNTGNGSGGGKWILNSSTATSTPLFTATTTAIGIFNASPNASALLDLVSTSKGILIPRMTDAQMNAISTPASGLRVSNSTYNYRPFWYNGTVWAYSPKITTGTAAPATTPILVGDVYVDTTNKKAYIATGIASSADWTIVN